MQLPHLLDQMPLLSSCRSPIIASKTAVWAELYRSICQLFKLASYSRGPGMSVVKLKVRLLVHGEHVWWVIDLSLEQSPLSNSIASPLIAIASDRANTYGNWSFVCVFSRKKGLNLRNFKHPVNKYGIVYWAGKKALLKISKWFFGWQFTTNSMTRR